MNGKPLTLRQAVFRVITAAGVCFVFAWLGRSALQASDKFFSVFYLITDAYWFLVLLLSLRNYLRVKSGREVMTRRKSSPATPEVQSRNLCIMMGVGTLAVIATTNLLARGFYTLKTLEERLFTVGFGMTLWLLHGLGWLWILSQRPLPAFAIQEQPEGVWPPAPLTAEMTRNED